MKAKSFFLKFGVLGVAFMSLFSGCYGFYRSEARELAGHVKMTSQRGTPLYALADKVDESCRWWVGRNRHYCAGQAEALALVAHGFGLTPDSTVAGALAGIRAVEEARRN